MAALIAPWALDGSVGSIRPAGPLIGSNERFLPARDSLVLALLGEFNRVGDTGGNFLVDRVEGRLERGRLFVGRSGGGFIKAPLTLQALTVAHRHPPSDLVEAAEGLPIAMTVKERNQAGTYCSTIESLKLCPVIVCDDSTARYKQYTS